jgi:hypothetical protein
LLVEIRTAIQRDSYFLILPKLQSPLAVGYRVNNYKFIFTYPLQGHLLITAHL